MSRHHRKPRPKAGFSLTYGSKLQYRSVTYSGGSLYRLTINGITSLYAQGANRRALRFPLVRTSCTLVMLGIVSILAHRSSDLLASAAGIVEVVADAPKLVTNLT